MTHRSKLELWLFAAIFYTVWVLAQWGDYWGGAPVLLILVILSFPHSYVLAPDAIRVRAGIARWGIPYRAIRTAPRRGRLGGWGVPLSREPYRAPARPAGVNPHWRLRGDGAGARRPARIL